MEFRILGPLEVVDGETPLAVPGIKERSVLAILLLHANELLPVDRLIEQLWSDEPPTTARKSLQVRVANLRKALGSAGAQLVTQGAGYVLRVDRDQLDLHRFERLVETAESLEPRQAAALLREALGLWRGPPLGDLVYEDFAQPAIARLEELRLAVVEKRIEADLAAGASADLVRELEALVAGHRLREGLRRQLMLALYRAGRQADALQAYRDARAVLNEELGLEPGPALQRLERAILSHDPSLELEAVPVRRSRAAPSGTVTFLFSDVEGSTLLVQSLGDEYGALLLGLRSLVREISHGWNGYEVDVQGDAMFFAFGRPLDAVEAAVGIQERLGQRPWTADPDVRMRIGIHTGTPSLGADGYYGMDVIRGSRICAAGHGGQVLVSDGTRALLPRDGAQRFVLLDLGDHLLRGLDAPERLFQLSVEGLREEFPPPRTAATAVDLGLPTASSRRSILVSPRTVPALDALLAVAEPITRGSARELMLLQPIADAEGLADAVVSLNARREDLLARGLVARSAAFTSSAPADDLVRTVAEQDVDLLLVDAPPAVLADEELSKILTRAASDVAVLFGADRAASDGPVLVPFGGGEHDWAAVELAARIAGRDRRLLLAGLAGEHSAEGRDASRLLASVSLAVQRALSVAAEPVLVEPGSAGLVRAANDAGLVVVGLSDRWRSDGLGPVRQAVALESRPPVLLVRSGLRPGVLAPPESVTRFTWTLRAG